jgi:hypothetical protein
MKSITINGNTGLSLQSFLRVLEMDAATCTVLIHGPRGESGSLFLVEGKLIDAEYGDMRGLDAAYKLCVSDSRFSIGPPVERLVQIDVPLFQIFLKAAALIDEEQALFGGVSDKRAIPLQDLVDFLNVTKGVDLFLLLNRQGKIIFQSSQEDGAGMVDSTEADPAIKRYVGLITYCAVTLINMAETERSAPESISVLVEGAKAVKIVFYQDMVLGLLLDHIDYAANVVTFLNNGKT